MDTLGKYNLPTFEQTRGHRYVTPILLHGGIPKDFLYDFFDFLQRCEVDPHQITVDPQSLLSVWRREADTYLAGLPRPVSRFLKYGGSVAEDFVDRCLDLFYEEFSDEVSLPNRVVTSFKQWQAEKGVQTRLTAPRVRLHKPILTLAPYTTGIGLFLPAQQFPSRAAPNKLAWQINLDGRQYQTVTCRLQRVEGGYQFAVHQEVTLPPATRYTFCLEADDEPLQSWELSGFADELPLLVFEPFDDYEGDALVDQEKVKPGKRWLAYPHNFQWQKTGNSRKLFDLPRLTGDWHDYKLEAWHLESGEMILQSDDGTRQTFTIIQERVRKRPHLAGGNRLPIPAAVSNFPLYIGRPPELKIYTHQPHRWQVILRSAGKAQPERRQSFKLSQIPHKSLTDGISVDLAMPDLLGEAPVGKFELVLRGPLGQTYHFGLRLIPTLEFEGLDKLYLQDTNEPAHFQFSCDDDTEIRQNPPQSGVVVHPPRLVDGQKRYKVEAIPDIKQLTLQLRHNSGVIIPLTIPIHRLRWGLHDVQAETEVNWQTEPTALFPGAITQGELWVDIPVLKDYPLHVGWQLIDTAGEIQREVAPADQPVQRHQKWSLDEATDVWRERQETLCWQLVVQTGDSDDVLLIPAFYLLPQPDFGNLLYEWGTVGQQTELVLMWEQPQSGSYQLQLWPLDRSWLREPIRLRFDGAGDLANWQLPREQLPAEAYLAELVAYNPWQSTLPRRPKRGDPNTLLIKPPAARHHYTEIAQLRDTGQASIEQLLALLAHQFYNDQQDELHQTNKAIVDLREMLSLIWLVRWLELTSGMGKTVYLLAQFKAFDQVVLTQLEQQVHTEDELDRYFRHFPKNIPESLVYKLYVWIFQSGLRHLRQRCLESLSKLPSDSLMRTEHTRLAFDAILNDVRDGAMLVRDAVDLLANHTDVAVDVLLQNGDQDAAELLYELACKISLQPDWIMPEMVVDTALGQIKVAKLRHRQSATPGFCVPKRSDFYAEGSLSIASGTLAVRLDLHNWLLQFENARPYLCQHCDELLGYPGDYTDHHNLKHAEQPQKYRRLKKDYSLQWLQPVLMLSANNQEVCE